MVFRTAMVLQVEKPVGARDQNSSEQPLVSRIDNMAATQHLSGQTSACDAGEGFTSAPGYQFASMVPQIADKYFRQVANTRSSPADTLYLEVPNMSL
jgi:hypothetical protein